MEPLLRVVPYMWRYRWRLTASVLVAMLVAALWGATLGLTYPVVQVFFEDKSIAQVVEEKIRVFEADVEKQTLDTQHYESRIEETKNSERPRADVLLDLQESYTRSQRRLTRAAHSLTHWNWIKTRILPWVPTDKFDTFALILGVLLAATVLKGIAMYVQEMLIGSVVELSVMSIRKECYRRALSLDYQSLSQEGTADLMSRFTFDTSQLSGGMQVFGEKLIREPLKALACIVGAFYVNWQLTLVSVLFVPITAFVFHRIGRTLKGASHRMMESMSRIYQSLEETFTSLKVVFAFNGQRRHRQAFHRENKIYYQKAMKVVQMDAISSPAMEIMATLAVLVAVLPGAYLVLRQTQTIWGIQLSDSVMEMADLGLLYGFLAGVLDPVRKMSNLYTKLKRSAAAAERIFQLIDSRPKVVEPKRPRPAQRLTEAVEFKNLTFAYANKGEQLHESVEILKDINLRVNHGEIVAVVGRNGCGKSTLVHLLPRFYDPTRGRVAIDGVPLTEFRLRDLRQQIGIVTQETLLFDDTIYNNILYGKPEATRSQVEAAARNAYVTQFLEQLPDGFQTKVGERGQRLSGGQRQRIAVARAMLRDPSILILDEATSAIDAHSEALIHKSLIEFVKGRTTFLITHAMTPTLLQLVTRVVVIDQGHIVGDGTHEELITRCGVYQQLFQSKAARAA